MKHLMSGNEATARGVYEAGIKVCSAYPGTPSTEILENLPQYGKDVYCEWAPNEKVATEVAYGASVAGSRSFCTMKMVGLNVAADPLFTAGYMGVNGAYSPYRHLELCGIALTKTKGEPINGKETCNALHHGRLRLDPGRNLWQRRCCCQ